MHEGEYQLKPAEVPKRRIREGADAARLSAKLLSPVEVAEITGLSIETLAQWRSRKQGIPYIKIARNCVRYRQVDLDVWVGERIVRVAVNQSQ
jgi:hypothetical protein